MLNRCVAYLCTHFPNGFFRLMMKQVTSGIALLLALLMQHMDVKAQAFPTPEAEQLYTQAHQYLINGNLRQAIPLYQQAIALAPDQVILYRDLANAWLLSGRYDEADKVITPVLDNGRGDEGCYQIAAASKANQKETKKARKILAHGLEKFPHSGMLYHEWGKMYDDENDEESALGKWLEGINADPAYRVNYYEAARTYMLTQKPVWALIYGEIFINMEPLTPRGFETRKLVMAAYKKIFTSTASTAPKFGHSSYKAATNFEEAVMKTFLKLAPVVSDGINTENLVMLRTRFMMDWQATYAAKYPFSLFSFQEDLLRNGYFDAYNQWLFGRAENATQFEGWQKFHPQAIPAFEQYLATRPLRPTAGDSWNDGKMKDLFAK